MGDFTKIEWADKTFNPWIGCMKVSAGCDHCYAESLAKRYGWVEWGQRKTDATEASVGGRKRTSAGNWRKPILWNRAAKVTGERPRVFCASLADVFDNQVDPSWRYDLFSMIYALVDLDWLLLTKRPENIAKMLPTNWGQGWQNVWIGTTCEDQAAYDKRWPILRSIPAAVHFISYEPAIGPLRLHSDDLQPDWLICGGESGPGARYMEPMWADRIRKDCRAEGVRFFMKQMTGKKPIPEDLMVRQFPVARINGVVGGSPDA